LNGKGRPEKVGLFLWPDNRIEIIQQSLLLLFLVKKYTDMSAIFYGI